MKKDSVRKNYIYNIIYEVIALLVPLVTTPYVSRVLGAEGVGAYSYADSVVTYFTVFALLGTTVYGRRETAYRQNDRVGRSRLYAELMIFRFCTILIAVILYLVYILCVSYSLIGLVMTLQLVAVYVDITWFYQGMEQFGKLVIRNIAVKVLGVAFIFTFVKTSNDLILYVAGFLGFSIASSLILVFGARQYVSYVPFRELKPFRHLRGAIVLFIPSIAVKLYQVLDKTMIGVLTVTNAENGYYEQAQKMIRICAAFVTTFALVVSPRMALAYAHQNQDELKKLLKKSYQFIWLLSVPIMFGLISITDNFVPWFFGQGFDKVKILLNIFSFAILPMGINAVNAQFLVSTKQQMAYNMAIVSGTVFNFVLNIILIPELYSVGASYATAAAEYLIISIQFYFIKRSLKSGIPDLFDGIRKYLFAGIVMFLAVRLVSARFAPSFLSTALLICLGGAVYFVFLALLGDYMLTDFIRTLKGKIRR